jgi:hypothetical protein
MKEEGGRREEGNSTAKAQRRKGDEGKVLGRYLPQRHGDTERTNDEEEVAEEAEVAETMGRMKDEREEFIRPGAAGF